MNTKRIRDTEWHMVLCQLPSFEIAGENVVSSAETRDTARSRYAFYNWGKSQQQDD